FSENAPLRQLDVRTRLAVKIVGTLLGFDDFVNMVLEDVTEFEITPEGRRITKLDQILLNGNNITMLIPGGEGPEV
uniref:U6 snRNA-associated Sm-like protein LSm5 n=1 Tax=Neolamprologus brichardi TaxID=32507 RepID=A0A3Q4GXG3_NEOBR